MPLGRRRNRIDRSLRERGVPPEPQHREREVEATSGPWDAADAPQDGLTRIDLGALRLPALPGMDLRVELNAQQTVIAATLRAGESFLQVSVFAAPRAGGIWDSVREDLAKSASGQGGSLREVDGPFGPELAGTIDAGYRGEIKVNLINLDPTAPLALRRGDRIAQLVVQPVVRARFLPVAELPDSERGDGGHGSTGGHGPSGEAALEGRI